MALFQTNVGKLTGEQVSMIRKMFDQYDTDGDGFIQTAEVALALAALDQVADWEDIKKLSANPKSELVSYESFLTFMKDYAHKRRRLSSGSMKLERRAAGRFRRSLTEPGDIHEEFNRSYSVSSLEDITDEQIKEVFEAFDTENKGCITTLDLHRVLGEHTPQEIQAMIAEGDLDKDGAISFQEFQLMIMRHVHQEKGDSS